MVSLLFAEPLIISALGSYAPVADQVKRIDGMTDFQSVVERGQFCPALFVGFYGERIVDTYDDGRANIVQQRWGVTTAVSSARDMQSGTAMREQAGKINMQICNCLAGHVLQHDVAPLTQLDTPAAVYRPGLAFFTTMWGLIVPRQFIR